MSTDRRTKKGLKGFTLLELLVALTILTIVIAMSISYINPGSQSATSQANALSSAFDNIETALNNYKEARGSYPITLTCDTTLTPVTQTCLPRFIPYFLLAPPRPTSIAPWFATDYYLYHYDNTTGQTYLCVQTNTALDEYQAEALQIVVNKAGAGKVYINSNCGALSSLSNIVGKQVAVTWWIVK